MEQHPFRPSPAGPSLSRTAGSSPAMTLEERRPDGLAMLVLGIETTCDETAAAVVERHDDGRATILANVVLSQIAEHAAFGGVVPEIAARAHVEALDLIIATAMADAGRDFGALDGVA